MHQKSELQNKYTKIIQNSKGMVMHFPLRYWQIKRKIRKEFPQWQLTSLNRRYVLIYVSMYIHIQVCTFIYTVYPKDIYPLRINLPKKKKNQFTKNINIFNRPFKKILRFKKSQNSKRSMEELMLKIQKLLTNRWLQSKSNNNITNLPIFRLKTVF